jgi:septal ring factor EnvC (AmiA/AmiB activator)
VRRALCLALVLCPALALCLPAPVGGQEGRLDELRKQIEKRETQAREYTEEAESYLGELEEIDKELAATRKQLKLLRRRRRTALSDRQRAEGQLAEVDSVLERARVQVARRLVALYKFRATGGFAALYSARDFQRVARRGRGLERVLESDGKLFDRYRELRDERNRVVESHARVVRRLERSTREVDAREAEVRQKLVERRNLVALLHSRADRERRAAAELREAARRLEDKLRRLPGHAKAGPGLSKGRVPWPVQGVLRLGFGRQIDPEFGTATLRNGIEVAALEGSPVRAVAPGRVLFAGWFRGYGQVVIVDHGRGHMTVSGYLEELDVRADQYVAADQVIGGVGETGSLSGPGLYFEVRKGGKPVDPEEWLE